MTLAEVAGAAYLNLIPDGMEPGLEETTFYDPENFVFPFGAHARDRRRRRRDRQGQAQSATSRSTTAATRSTRC